MAKNIEAATYKLAALFIRFKQTPFYLTVFRIRFSAVAYRRDRPIAPRFPLPSPLRPRFFID
ncbi:hypothetical protein [Burkholderia stagnalis]|uniref:Uncharacterized protein n=1 Tax=Burkholderia stagnalis TaxID=1503054 RepID=A0A6L3N5C9_9BURK|nr:hypothetical protein [Burkholderia stagnalis]KAB0640329.1 hypothetical protein F7R25_04660 [Burkholderia stagnalis]